MDYFRKNPHRKKLSGNESNWRDNDENKETGRVFEKIRLNTCFISGSGQHLKSNYPENKRSEKPVAKIDHLRKYT